MSTETHELGSLLRLLQQNAHPAALNPNQIELLERSIAQGLPGAQTARRAGLDPRLVRVLSLTGPTDLPCLLRSLQATLAEHATHSAKLAGAAFYPLMLTLAVILSGASLLGLALPAFARLPDAQSTVGGGLALGSFLLCLLLLFALGFAVAGRFRVPYLGQGHQDLDRFASLACARALVEAGRPLPEALRASAAWCEGLLREKGESLARTLEAGGSTSESEPLLSAFESSLFLSAARLGTVPASLEALVEQQRRALERSVPEQCARVQLGALLLAGLALLSLAVPFILAYSRAVAGLGGSP